MMLEEVMTLKDLDIWEEGDSGNKEENMKTEGCGHQKKKKNLLKGCVGIFYSLTCKLIHAFFSLNEEG